MTGSARGLGLAVVLAGAAMAGPAFAQALGEAGAPAAAASPFGLQDLDQVTGGLGRNAVLLLLSLTLLSLAPGLAIMVTCFPFIVTVLSILRQSLGLPQSPPNMLIIALSLMLTWFVMDPVLREAWQVAGAPLQAGSISMTEAFERGVEPFRGFMTARTDPETYEALADVAPRGAFTEATGAGTEPDPRLAPAGEPAGPQPSAVIAPLGADAPLAVLVPAFMLSEVQRAFEVGFLIALPFLVIDLVVSAVLMSMGMMMVPPAVVSLPFKLAFFVVVDGWGMVAGALVRSYQ